MKVYISLPMTGCENTVVRRGDIAKSHLESLGHEAFSTIGIDTPITDEKERYAWFMGQSIYLLLQCDAIYLCKGWQNSKGCRTEMEAAQIYGLHIYNEGEIF